MLTGERALNHDPQLIAPRNKYDRNVRELLDRNRLAFMKAGIGRADQIDIFAGQRCDTKIVELA